MIQSFTEVNSLSLG